MNHVLDSRCRQGLVDGMWKILKDHTARHVRESLFELGALMADATAHIHIHRCSWIPVLCFFFYWIYREPRYIGASTKSHVVVEEFEFVWVVFKPCELVHVGLPSSLKYGMHRIVWVSISRLLHISRQFLIFWANCLEAVLCSGDSSVIRRRGRSRLTNGKYLLLSFSLKGFSSRYWRCRCPRRSL